MFFDAANCTIAMQQNNYHHSYKTNLVNLRNRNNNEI